MLKELSSSAVREALCPGRMVASSPNDKSQVERAMEDLRSEVLRARNLAEELRKRLDPYVLRADSPAAIQGASLKPDESLAALTEQILSVGSDVSGVSYVLANIVERLAL